jgi:hypothetical protein
MKNFNDLTKAELAELSHDDIVRYINLACAEEGIPLVPELPEKPIEPSIVPDKEYYSIAGHTLATMEDAEKVQRVFNGIVVYSENYSKRCGNLHVYDPDERSWNDPTKIIPIKAMSNELYAQRLKEVESYKTAKGEYDRIEEKFKKIKEQRKSVEESHWAIYRDAVEWKSDMEQAKRTFAQYLELADGDKGIAWKFLVKANEYIEETYPDLKAELVQ